MVQRSNNNANTNGGVACVNANNDSSNTNSNNGSRLANISESSTNMSSHIVGWVRHKARVPQDVPRLSSLTTLSWQRKKWNITGAWLLRLVGLFSKKAGHKIMKA